MNDVLDDMLRERAQRAFDAEDDSDWHEVLSRAGVQRQRPGRSVVAVAFASLTAIAFLIAPGPGLGYLRGLFGGEPAPPDVKERVASADDGAPANLAPGIDADQTRRLIEIQMSDGRRATLWVAPAKSGDICSYVQRGPHVSGGPGCRAATLPDTAPIDWLLQGATASDQVVLLSGSVSDRINRLSIHYEDGLTSDIELTQQFFLIEISRLYLRAGHHPTSLVGYGLEGAEVGRVTLTGVGIYPPSG